MRVDGVIRAEQAGQRTAHRGCFEHLPDLRHMRQNVVARIPVPGQHGADPVPDPRVETCRKSCLYLEISIDDEAAHRGVVK